MNTWIHEESHPNSSCWCDSRDLFPHLPRAPSCPATVELLGHSGENRGTADLRASQMGWLSDQVTSHKRWNPPEMELRRKLDNGYHNPETNDKNDFKKHYLENWSTKGRKCRKTLKGNRAIPRQCKSKNLKSARKYVQEHSYAWDYLWDMRSWMSRFKLCCGCTKESNK